MAQLRRRPSVLITAALLAAAYPLLVVLACGPDFQAEVFTPGSHPEDTRVFATGKLGILQARYWQADKIVAYRYLIGGHLSPAEQAVYNPPLPAASHLSWQAQQQAEQEQTAASRWVAARARFTRQTLASAPSPERIIEIPRPGFAERETQLNCPDNAFETAITTLQARAQSWGPQDAGLQDWITGQDAVFSNCSQAGTEPQPTPVHATQLLRQDRAYQIAAAHFYAMRYDQAIAAFASIAQDTSSPWSRWGEYLAARAEIRKASSTVPYADWGERAEFDLSLLKSAQEHLQRATQTSDPQIRHAAMEELSFVNVRLEPQKHLNEAATALAGPSPDPDFARHLNDLRFLADHNVTGDTDLLLWMGLAGESGQKGDPWERWSANHSNPWLLSALAVAKANSPQASVLLAAAAKLPADSPAYASAMYHSIDLLLQSGEREQARQQATTLLKTINGSGMAGSRNAVLALRMLTAPTFAAFLEDAPRTVMQSGSTSQAAAVLLCDGRISSAAVCVKQIPSAQFDQDAALVFNQQLPLALWVQAANAHTLPQNLTQAIAWAGWVRAIALHEDGLAQQLAPLLPETVRATARDSTGFPATLAMLRNPGLRPYIEQGVQRSASYSELDTFRDNWWCQKAGDGSNPTDNGSTALSRPTLVPAFVTPDEQEAARTQAAALNQLPNGVAWLGRRAIDYVQTHPDDPNAAESLALTVRATRYGCYLSPAEASPQKTISKEAFQLLHQRYPTSPWTAKTPYFY
jgi:tetratricopeptide (TPR) repeat protein